MRLFIFVSEDAYSLSSFVKISSGILRKHEAFHLFEFVGFYLKRRFCIFHKHKAFYPYVSEADYLFRFLLKSLFGIIKKHEDFHLYVSEDDDSNGFLLKSLSCILRKHEVFQPHVSEDDLLVRFLLKSLFCIL